MDLPLNQRTRQNDRNKSKAKLNGYGLLLRKEDTVFTTSGSDPRRHDGRQRSGGAHIAQHQQHAKSVNAGDGTAVDGGGPSNGTAVDGGIGDYKTINCAVGDGTVGNSTAGDGAAGNGAAGLEMGIVGGPRDTEKRGSRMSR